MEHWPKPDSPPGYCPFDMYALLPTAAAAHESDWDCGTSMEARAAALKACRAAIDAGVDETIKGSVEAVFLGMQWQTGNCASKLVDDQAVCTHC